MTENYSALPMIENLLLRIDVEPDVIFGSSFPRDQDFTQVSFPQTTYQFIYFTIFFVQIFCQYLTTDKHNNLSEYSEFLNIG